MRWAAAFGVLLLACVAARADEVGAHVPPAGAALSHERPCWSVDSASAGQNPFQVLLIVTTDATGTVREAEVSPDNTGDMSNPLYFAFTQRALAAVLNPQCTKLPLPASMLGQNQTFTFLFSP